MKAVRMLGARLFSGCDPATASTGALSIGFLLAAALAVGPVAALQASASPDRAASANRAAQAPDAASTGGSGTSVDAGAPDPLAVQAEPADPAVGDVVRVRLVASQPLPVVPADGDALAAEREAREALRARFPAQPFGELGPDWELLELGPVVITRTASALEGGAGRLVAEQRARLVPFAPGDQALPLAPGIASGIGPAELPRFAVRGVLGPDEDAPRDPGGLDAARAAPWELPPAPTERPWQVWAGSAAAGLGLLLAGLLVWKRSGRAPAATGAPLRALERLADEAAQHSGPAVQAAHYPLTALARRAWEQHLGERSPRGTTDAEWLQRFGPRLDDPGAWRTWFADCAAIKYGGEPATAWGLEERARFVLARVPAQAPSDRVTETLHEEGGA